MPDNHFSLMRPTIVLEKDFRSMIAEFRANGEANIESIFESSGCQFNVYLKRIQAAEFGEQLPAGFVPYSTYWLVQNRRRIVGISHLRHRLTPDLEIEGGHIGYSIRPSDRRKGYGTLQLSLLLDECRQIGLKNLMITCDYDNIGSYKIIEANGGVFRGDALSPRSGKCVLHYWVSLDDDQRTQPGKQKHK